MADLRSEIREAFEKEQAAHPPAIDLRRSVVRAVTAQPRRPRNLQWMAVAATVVIGALVVGGLLSTRSIHGTVPAHPKASPTAEASPLSDYGPPPAGVALIYVQDQRHPGWYIGFDWTGKPRGTVKFAPFPSTQAKIVQAADGSAFAEDPAGKGGFGQFFDRLGQPVSTDTSVYQSQKWADNNRQLCTLGYDASSNQWRIGLRTPQAPPPAVHPVAIDPSIVRSGIIALAFAACSAVNDRAVLTYAYFGLPMEVWVVRISDGAILFHETVPANLVSDVTASPDGALIAENSSKSTGLLMGDNAPQTTIRRVSDNHVMLSLDPTYGVLAFNSDNSLALIHTSPWASNVTTQLAVVDIRTGAIVWRSSGQVAYITSLVQPDGRGFALILQKFIDGPAVWMLIVHADGIETVISGPYLQP